MRITGGVWRSRRLHGPGRTTAVRPTPDAMRERAFAVLGERVVGAVFLDLFSGTGAVALEALSRGAAAAVCVEHHRSAARLIRENLAQFGLENDRARILVQPADAAVAGLARRGESFDIIWADPPFEKWEEGLDAVAAAFSIGLMAGDATGCLECPERAAVEATLPEGLALVRDLRGGASRVVLIRRKNVQR